MRMSYKEQRSLFWRKHTHACTYTQVHTLVRLSFIKPKHNHLKPLAKSAFNSQPQTVRQGEMEKGRHLN